MPQMETSIKCNHNRPDAMITNWKKKLCLVVESICENVDKKLSEKENIFHRTIVKYDVTLSRLQIQVYIPVIIGTLVYVTKCVNINLE